jgi:hypothetical protein
MYFNVHSFGMIFTTPDNLIAYGMALLGRRRWPTVDKGAEILFHIIQNAVGVTEIAFLAALTVY